jgi:hypothetical protein
MIDRDEQNDVIDTEQNVSPCYKQARLGGVCFILLLIMAAIIFQPLLSQLFLPVSIERWEYCIESPDDHSFTSNLNTLGKDGWELVSTRRARNPISEDMVYECVFKRKKIP